MNICIKFQVKYPKYHIDGYNGWNFRILGN